jgi:glycosyltransferase involved in cell wall biosynthesis
MGTYPKISVITPSFNQAQFLERTIESVLSQGYPNLEYIVMDGGSTDGSVEILRKYDRYLSRWVSEPDRGQSHAFNKGLSCASGDIVGWINSDDLYLTGSLFEVVRYFAENPDVAIVFSDYIFIDGEDKILKFRKEIPFSLQTYIWARDCFHANCAGFFRKRVFSTVGGLDESLHYGMDFDLYLRAGSMGIKVGHVHGYWGAYRLHQASKSISAYDRQVRDAVVILEKYTLGHGIAQRFINRACFRALRIVRKFFLGSYFLRATGHTLERFRIV